MITTLYFAPFEPPLKTGLLIYSLCAGAPLRPRDGHAASTLGFVMLLFIARALRRDSKVERESAGYFQRPRFVLGSSKSNLSRVGFIRRARY
jgi:hypothetical protein